MAKWRAEAIKRLPELRKVIDSAQSVMALWVELQSAFVSAYKEPRNHSLIARVYSYARWCQSAPRGRDAGCDPGTAVCVAFFEHIPTIEPARNDMPRWFTRSEVIAGRELFSYHIGDVAYRELIDTWPDG